MGALGDSLRAMAGDADSLSNDNARLTSELQTAKTDLTAALADLDAANARIAELEAQQPPPAPLTEWVVKAGDTLFSISQATGVSVTDLKTWNNLTSDTITVGQVLKLIAPETNPDPPPDPVPTGKLALGHVALHGSGTWTQKAQAAEAKFGKFQGSMRVYFGTGSTVVLTSELKAWLDGDPTRKLIINWKPGSGWDDAGSGRIDSTLASAAKSLAPYVGRVKLIIWHEPENDGVALSKYVPMWRHVAPILHSNAPGLQLGWCMMGAFSGAGRDTTYYSQLWPGPDYVDFLAHDPYIVKGAAATKLPTNMINGANGLRALSGAAGLPVVAAEWGADLGGASTDRGTDQHRADAIDAVTARLGDLIACGHVELTFYDDGSDYLSDSGPDVAAYKRLKAATEK